MKDKDYKMLEEAYKKVNKKTTKKKDEGKVEKLAKQDPREVEGYSKSEESDTYKEAHEFPPIKGEGEEWHGLGAKEPQGKFDASDMVKHLGMGDLGKSKAMSELDDAKDLSRDLEDVIQKYEEEYGINPSVGDLAKAFADIIVQYGSHNKEKFLAAINAELNK